ncbi:MAG: aldo/keto reductase [Armatimonadota bacterium]|nr:MAG: aldo/keto reductase [Armatimonadota bacterium]
MRATTLGDLTLSGLMLGTVQLGMPYGIANRSGQPSYETARAIIACAYEGGVNCFDTAAAYGASEEVLGRALAELGIAERVVVATKIQHLTGAASRRQASRMIEESVASSLRALRLDALPICLFHLEQDFRYADCLAKLRDNGAVRLIGASVMTPEATAEILRSGPAEAIQLPVNLLDQRFVRQGVLAEARRRGTAVFARSVYLQGLLLMPEEDIPPQLREATPIRRKLAAVAAEAGMSLAELAVRYVLGIAGMTCAVVGVETVAQMRNNLTLFAKGPLDAVLMETIAGAVPDLPDRVLMPSQWFAGDAPHAGR